MRSLKLFAKQLFRAKDKLVNAKFIIQRPLIYKKLFSQEFWRSVTIIIWKQVFYTFTVYCNTLRQSIFPIYLMILLQRVVVKLILLWRSCFTSYWSHKNFSWSILKPKIHISYRLHSYISMNVWLLPLSKKNQMGNIALSLVDLLWIFFVHVFIISSHKIAGGYIT